MKQRPLIFAGLAITALLLVLLYDWSQESVDLISEARNQQGPTHRAINLKPKKRPRTIPISKVSAPTIVHEKGVTSTKDSPRIYVGRVVDKQGFGLPRCRILLTDDSEQYRPESTLYDELKRRAKLKEGVQSKSNVSPAAKKPGLQCYQTLTDKDGRFSIELKQDFIHYPLLLLVKPTRGFQEICRDLILPKDRDFGVFVMEQTGKVYGAVFNHKHKAFENAAVVLIDAVDYDRQIHAGELEIYRYPYRLTGPDGRYEFGGVPVGDYYLICKAAKARETAVPITVGVGSMVRQDLELEPGQHIDLTLQDRERKNILGAEVTLKSIDSWDVFNEIDTRDKISRRSARGVTNRLGQVTLGPLYERRALLSIRAPGFGESRHWIESSAGQNAELRIILDSSCVVKGRLVDADNRVTKATVIVEALNHIGERTREILIQKNLDQSGSFQIETLSPGRYFLRIARIQPDYYEMPLEEHQQFLTIPKNNPILDLGTLRLSRLCVVLCTILDPTGRAVPDVDVLALQRGQKIRSKANLGDTDDQGVTQIEGLTPGTVTLVVRSNDGPLAFEKFEIPDSPQSDLTLQLPNARGQLRVLVVDHLGRPVTSGCLVVGTPKPDFQHLQIGDDLSHEKGRCTFNNLPPGRVSIYFHSEYPTPIRRLELGEFEIGSGVTTERTLQLPKPK